MVFIKKRCHKAISMFLIMTMVFTSVLGLTGCKKDEETKAETVETAETEAVNTDEVVKDLDKIYECELVMGEGMTMMLYLKIDDKGNFVFSRSTDFSSDEKGAGKVYKTEDGEYYMEYSVVNGEEVEPGEYVSTFEIDEDDTIIFTSPMWFGSTSPSYEVDGKEVYPEFVVSDEEEITDGEKESETEEEDGDASDFRTGTYGGTYNTTAMGNPLTYSCTIRFNANGTYIYTVKFHIMGSTRTETESGTYTQNGTIINMVSNSGTSTSARITTSGLALTRYISSFAFSSATVSMTYGYTPGVVINNSGSTSESESESETSGTTDNENQDKEPEIDESVTELVGGTYAVDISWSPMASMMSPVLSVNKAAMTFDIYNKSNPSASKGAGTITEENGVYTLNYENGNKVTFTFAGGVITFTSPLYYGSASFNSATVSGGDFVPYTATIIEAEGTVPEQPEESDSLSSGTYKVDISWSGSAAWRTPILDIDAEKMTFNIFDASSDMTVSKGNGTITYKDGVYTLVYEGGDKTTTFTYTDELITFTSKLWYGAASYDQKDDNGNFISYTAEPYEVEGGAGDDTEDDFEVVDLDITSGTYEIDVEPLNLPMDIQPMLVIDADNNTFNIYEKNDPSTSKGSGHITYKDGVYSLVYPTTINGTNITTFTFENDTITFTSFVLYGTSYLKNENYEFVTHTAKLVVDEEYTVAPGTYCGTYQTTAMSSTVDYLCTLVLNADGTYSYSVEFAVRGNTYTQSESGTYSLSANTLTLKTDAPNSSKADAGENTAIVTSNNAFTLTRYISSMAGSKADVEYTVKKSEVAFVTGNYGGEYTNVSSSGKETNYTYTLLLSEDGTYVYTSVFAMGATTYTQTENGTYVTEEDVITLTSGGLKVTEPDGNVVMENAASETMTGTIDATGKAATITRYVSYFASKNGKQVELPLTYGFTPSTDEPTVELYTVEPGTYTGIHVTTAMGSNVEYACQLVLNENGTYSYRVVFTMMGKTYTQNESGTYTSSNNTMTFSTDSPNSSKDGANENTATIAADNMFILNRYVSSFASSKVDVVYKVGEVSTPSVPESGTDSGETENDSTTENTAVITSGAYNVDISWSPMASYFSPILSIDGDAMTFNVYNATAPETSKGSGTITEANGVFTLNYENGNTTTFTYAGGVITFTSKLWYGSASFARVDDSGSFVSYTASMNSSGSDETEEVVKVEPGTYGASYSTAAMSSTIDYAITLVLNEDKTYDYTVAFTAMGSQTSQRERGTYAIDGTTITLTPSSSEINKDTTIIGIVTGDNIFTLTRHVSSYASSAVEIQFTVGASNLSAASETEVETPVETEAETVAETEAETVAETEAETVAETEAETAAETEAETVAETEAETVAETEAETVAETEAETVAETEAETVAETEAETVTETEAETVTETEAETVAETEAETAAEIEAETAAEIEAETAVEE